MNNLLAKIIIPAFLFFFASPALACDLWYDIVNGDQAPTAVGTAAVYVEGNSNKYRITSTSPEALYWYGPVSGGCQASHGINQWAKHGSNTAFEYFTRSCVVEGSYYKTYYLPISWAAASGDWCNSSGEQPAVDSDGDGFPDDCDLFPNSIGQPTQITIEPSLRSVSTGQVSCSTLRITKAGLTKTLNLMHVAGGCNLDGSNMLMVTINGPKPKVITQAELCTMLGQATPPPGGNYISGGSNSTIGSAYSNATSAAISALSGGTVDANGTVTGLPSGVSPVGGDYGNSTAVNEAMIRNQQIQIEQQANATAAQALRDQQQQKEDEDLLDKLLDEVGSLLGIGDYDFDTTLPPPADFEDGETITYWFEFLESNAFTSIIEDVGIIASDGGCTYSGSYTLMGNSHSQTISFCNFEGALVMMGNILVALCSLQAVAMMLVGRWF